MLVKNIIEKLQQNGYDTFYWASLLDKVDTWVLCVGNFLLLLGVKYLLGLFGIPSIGDDLFKISTILVLIIFLPKIIMISSKQTAAEQGKSDVRLTWLFCDFLSKIILFMIKWLPLCATFIMFYFYFKSSNKEQYSLLLLIAVGVVMIASIIPYKKVINNIANNAVYYVNWKKDHFVQNFDDYAYSRRDSYHTPMAFFDFEKENTDRFRSMEYVNIISNFSILLIVVYFFIAFIPVGIVQAKETKSEKNSSINNDNNSSIKSDKTKTNAFYENKELLGENSTDEADLMQDDNPYAWLSERLATADDLAGKSKYDIKIMRNTIFAMHGYIFKTDDMKEYFSKQTWYKPQKEDVNSDLSSIEHQNIQFLKKNE